METKTCNKCHEEKSIDCFTGDSRYKYGNQPTCKQCKAERASKQRAAQRQAQKRLEELSKPSDKSLFYRGLVVTHYNEKKNVWQLLGGYRTTNRREAQNEADWIIDSCLEYLDNLADKKLHKTNTTTS